MKENKIIQQILQRLGALNRFARIGIFLAIVLPVLALVIINYFALKKELTNSAFSRRLAIAQVAAITLSQKFNHLKDIGTSLASAVHLRELISNGQWSEGIKIMSEVTKNLPIIDQALLVDVAGNVKADLYKDPKVLGKNFKYREWYQKLIEKGEPYVSNIYKRANEPLYNIIAVAVPIKNENKKLIGILLLQVLLDPPFNWVNTIQIGPSGYIYIVDGNGNLAFHPKYSSQVNIIDYKVIPVVKKVLQGKEGVEVNFNPLENEERLSAYSPVPGYGWGVVVQEPTTTAFAFRNSSLKRRLFESFIFLVLTCVLALVVLNIVSKLIAKKELVFQNEEKERKAAELVIANKERAEEILFNASRMSALGEMASGIAHEINNPLSIIIMKGSQLIRKYQTDTLSGEELEEGLTKITSTAQRIGKVVKGLSSISRNSENDPMEKINLVKVIEETLQLGRERFNSFSIKLHVDLEAINGIEIDGRASQIMQVLLNLLNNALDAVMALDEKWVAVKAIPNDFGVVISVTDSGYGIPNALLAKIMQPFFTTKEVGVGTGLGLSISKQMVDEHQGLFYYQKNSNHTCFVIELPYTQQPKT